MIEQLGLSDLADRQIGQLSGGQQQRALLARALAQAADLLLLDEPLNAVDAVTRTIISGVLSDLRAQGKTVVTATHDLGRLESDFDGALYLAEGREVPPPPGAFDGMKVGAAVMIEWLTAPFQYGFMQTALLAAVLVGLACASIGVYVVLRRMAFIGDALAHTVLPGLVVAYLNQFNLFGGALIAGVLTALGIGWLSRREQSARTPPSASCSPACSPWHPAHQHRALVPRSLAHPVRQHPRRHRRRPAADRGDHRRRHAAAGLFHKELELTSFDPIYAEVIGLRRRGCAICCWSCWRSRSSAASRSSAWS